MGRGEGSKQADLHDGEELLSAALREGSVHVFMRADEGIYRIPREDVRWLSENWDAWFGTGIVPEGVGRYSRGRLLLSEREVDRWLESQGTESQLQKSGAPGRPSSMWRVLQEHKRRFDNGECAISRMQEAKDLASWFAKTYPEHPPVRAQSIRNALPKSFQPHNSARRKL
jgi:hypothetical protein